MPYERVLRSTMARYLVFFALWRLPAYLNSQRLVQSTQESCRIDQFICFMRTVAATVRMVLRTFTEFAHIIPHAVK